MKKIVLGCFALLIGTASAAILDDSIIAIWPNFTSLTPSYTGRKTLTNVTLDGRNLSFDLGDGTVTNGVLYTGTGTAPSIALNAYNGTTAQSSVNVGYYNQPICHVLAIQGAVSTNVLNKPFVHAGNGSTGVGMALKSDDGDVRGTWADTYWNNTAEVAVPTLVSNEVTYIAFYMTYGATKIGIIDPAAGSVSWTNLSTSLTGSSVTASKIVFGNFVNSTTGGMNYQLVGFGLVGGTASVSTSNYSTATPDDGVIDCARYIAAKELKWNSQESGNGNYSWSTVSDYLTWLSVTNNAESAYENGARVSFGDILKTDTENTYVSPMIVLFGESVAPYEIVTISNTTQTVYGFGQKYDEETDYLTYGSYGITNNPVIVKQGEGEVSWRGPTNQTTQVRISEVIVENGTFTSYNDYCLATAPSAANNPVGPKLTVKGGTLDLANTAAYDTSTYKYWLTESTITMGGSATAATIKNAAFVPYSGSTTAMDFLTYVGEYTNADNTVSYSPPALFAAALANSYSNSAFTRTVTVGQGQGTIDSTASAYTGYDLDMTGGIGTTGQYAGTSLIKAGAGTLRISCTNNLSTMTINEGTVVLNNAKAASDTMSIASGATLDLNGFACTNATFSGAGIITNSSTTTSITLQSTQLTDFTGTVAGNIGLVVDLSTVLEACDLTGADFNFTFTGTGEMDATNSLPSSILQYDSENKKVTETISPLPYQITWMPVGDSITEGEPYMGTTEGTDARSDGTDGGYRFQLWKFLETNGQDVVSVGFRSGHRGTDEAVNNPDWAWHCAQYGGTIDPMNSGNGAASYNVESSFEVAGYPEVITLMLGINDLSYLSRNWSGYTYANVYDSWTNLVTKLAKARPLSKIVVSPLFPCISSNVSYSIRPYFNTLMRNAADAKEAPFDLPNVIFCDVPELAMNDTFNANYFKSSDGLHPNRAGSILFAKAFRLGILEALESIRTNAIAVAQVHNATSGKVTVRFDRPVETVTSATLTITGSDVDGNAVSLSLSNPSISSDNARLIEFDLGENTLIGGTYTLALTATLTDKLGTTVTNAEIDMSNVIDDIAGTGVAENIPATLREGLVPYQTITFGDNDNFSGTGPTDGLTQHTNGISYVSRVGYYLELQRPGQPAQYVWAAMDTTLFGDRISSLGIPTTSTGAFKGEVQNMTVYGNHGNFKKEGTSETGIVEITPWNWTATDEDDYPDEAYSGRYGWNDTIETAAGTLKGCFQIFRETGDTGTPLFGHPRAEPLMAINNFNRDNQTDLAIGSFSAMWTNNGSTSTGIAVVYDWTDFCAITLYTNFYPSAYTVKKMEVWVEPIDSVNTWTGEGDGVTWSDASNWSLGEVPADGATVEVPLTGDLNLTVSEATAALANLVILNNAEEGSTPTLTFSDPANVKVEVLDADGVALVLTSEATTDAPTTFSPKLTGTWAVTIQSGAFTLNDENTYEGTTVIAEGATLVVSTAAGTPLGTSTVTGAGSVMGDVVSTGLNLTDEGWTGTYVFSGTSFSGLTPASLGNSGSTFEMASDSSGYFATGTTTVKMKLSGTVSVSDGFSSGATALGELMGSGELKFTGSPSQAFSFTAATNFTGTITYSSGSSYRLGIGETASTDMSTGYLIIGTDATINPHDNTWTISKGVTLNGTLTGSGTITVLSGSLSGTGTIALDKDDTLVVKVTGSVADTIVLDAIPEKYEVVDTVTTDGSYTVHTYTVQPKGIKVYIR